MLRTALHTGSALTLLVLSASLGWAQVQTQPAPGTGTGAGTHALRAKSILGATVSLQGGTSVGTVHDIVFNDDGVVDYLIVAEGGKLVTVPWEAAKFNFEKRTAVINITPERFRQIPTYTAERYPDFYTPAYRTQVYQYFGLTPGQERRLERREQRRP
jgi:sporulation protein YlmC with PRC-barrel domain